MATQGTSTLAELGRSVTRPRPRCVGAWPIVLALRHPPPAAQSSQTSPFPQIFFLDPMAAPSQVSVAQLADQLAAGFAALSGEYQLLLGQQRQLEDKLSFAKQQVRGLFSYVPQHSRDDPFLALDL